MSYRGLFQPKNPGKYLGDSSNIVWRSLWERSFMKYCDETPGVLKWASEELFIPYVSPVDGRVHRYFPDFMLEVQSTSGVKRFVIEVKPKAQTELPRERKRKTKRFITEMATYAINQAKWNAAKAWCEQQGLSFLVFTEDVLFKQFR